MKKLLRCAVLGIIALTVSFSAQSQWSLIHSLYGGQLASDGAAAFTIGNKGYIVAGSTDDHLYMYDTTANAWTNKGTVPMGMGHAFAMSFTLNGKGYIVGGDTAGYTVSTVWSYDPASTTTPWTQLNDFPGGTRDGGISFVINDTAYVGCGFDGATMYGDLWRYDAANDAWTQMPNSLPTFLIFPASFVINNRAYVMSGGTLGGLNETNQMWEFNSATQTWIPKAAYPGLARQAALAFSNDSYGYFGGGMAGYTTNYYDMWRYNPDSNSWSAAGNMPLFGAAWSSVFTIGNTAYAGLGAKFVGSALQGTDSFYRFRMQIPTGISEVGRQQQIAVSPNPAMDFLHLSIPGNITCEAIIYDCIGKAVKTTTISGNADIDIKSLAPGAYLLQVKNDKDISYARFMKQ